MFRDGHKSFMTRLGARFGLLALALQLVLSFGHIHPLPSQITTIAAPAGNTGGPDLPMADGACAICASIAAFASLDLTVQADIAPPATVAEMISPVTAAGAHHAAPIRYFSSRAPPAA
ncbi:MAG: hypothetical protein JO218_08900 [Burkholderiales bacterium]|nr:hypothetical protein [Burkholderiales bacterium]